MKMNKLITNTTKTIFTVVLLIIACLGMNNFYKMTLGLVANDFEGGLFHLTIMIAYILPFICFVFYFYNYYVNRVNKIVSLIYSIVIIGISIFILVGIFTYIEIYVRNHSLGVYGALPSLLGGFPYDSIITCVALILVQVLNITSIFKQDFNYRKLKEEFYSLNYFSINTYEYLAICVISLLVFFFTGDAFSGFMMLKNVIYDPKYLFILAWLLLGTMGNLLCYVFKFENKLTLKNNKIIYLGSIVLGNVLLVVLFVLFETISPNFIAHLAKALFPITFSISLPLEIMFVFGIQAIAVLVAVIKILLILLKKDKLFLN